MDSDISFRQHSAGHTPTPNWPVFLDFAARYFDKTQNSQGKTASNQQ